MSIISLTGRVGGNDAIVAALGRAAFPASPSGPLAILGTSSSQRGITYASPALAKNVLGPFVVLEALMGGAYYTDNHIDGADARGHSGLLFGASGVDYTVLKDSVPAVIASGAKICLVADFNTIKNTQSGAAAYSLVYANLIAPLLDAGLTVLWHTMIPLGSGGSTPATSPVRDAILDYNERVRAAVGTRPGLYCLDPFGALVDSTSSTKALLKAAYDEDGSHTNSFGSAAWASALRSQMAKFWAPAPVYDPSLAAGNRFVNGLLSGTGGTIGAGFTGTLPDYVSASRSSGTATNVVDVLDDPTGGAGKAIRCVGTQAGATVTQSRVTFNGAAASPTDNQGMTLAHLNIATGDWVVGRQRVLVRAGFELLMNLNFYLEQRTAIGSGAVRTANAFIGVTSGSTAYFDTTLNGYVLTLRTPPFQIESGVTHLAARTHIIQTATAGAFTAFLAAPEIRKL